MPIPSLLQFSNVLEETPSNSVKWMYDRNTMPNDLKQAHQALDKAIEQCYRLQPFNSDNERLEYLFKLYEKMIAEEASNPTPKKAKR